MSDATTQLYPTKPMVGARPITKKNWLEVEGKLFSRITEIRETAIRLESRLRNAAFSFDEMTTSIVAVAEAAGDPHQGGQCPGGEEDVEAEHEARLALHEFARIALDRMLMLSPDQKPKD